MPRVEFTDMPPSARLWIFAAERALDPSERDQLLSEVDAFLDQWAAHGVPLRASRDLRHDRFLFVAADEQATGASGCSIDAMVRTLKGLQDRLSVRLIDHGPVQYRTNGEIARASRDEFAELAATGAVDERTTVFNNTVTTVGDLSRWEVPAARSWHGAVFFS
jgi:hypothetical protein